MPETLYCHSGPVLVPLVIWSRDNCFEGMGFQSSVSVAGTSWMGVCVWKRDKGDYKLLTPFSASCPSVFWHMKALKSSLVCPSPHLCNASCQLQVCYGLEGLWAVGEGGGIMWNSGNSPSQKLSPLYTCYLCVLKAYFNKTGLTIL